MPPLYPRTDVGSPATIRPPPAPAPQSSHTTTAKGFLPALGGFRRSRGPLRRILATRRGSRPEPAPDRIRGGPRSRPPFLGPVGPVNLVEPGLGELNVLGAGALFERKHAARPWGPMTSAAAPVALASRSSANEPTVRLAGPPSSLPRYRAVCSTKGTNEACSGKSLATLSNVEANTRTRPCAHLAVEQQRRVIGKPRHHARVARRHADRLVELHVFPAVVVLDGGMRGIQPRGRLETLAFPPRVARLFDACRRRPARACAATALWPSAINTEPPLRT